MEVNQDWLQRYLSTIQGNTENAARAIESLSTRMGQVETKVAVQHAQGSSPMNKVAIALAVLAIPALLYLWRDVEILKNQFYYINGPIETWRNHPIP